MSSEDSKAFQAEGTERAEVQTPGPGRAGGSRSSRDAGPWDGGRGDHADARHCWGRQGRGSLAEESELHLEDSGDP